MVAGIEWLWEPSGAFEPSTKEGLGELERSFGISEVSLKVSPPVSFLKIEESHAPLKKAGPT